MFVLDFYVSVPKEPYQPSEENAFHLAFPEQVPRHMHMHMYMCMSRFGASLRFKRFKLLARLTLGDSYAAVAYHPPHLQQLTFGYCVQ